MAKQGLNAGRMKERNYRRFFSTLRFRPMTRAQLAREMGLTRAATSNIAEDLISIGIIREVPFTYKGHFSSKALSWNKAYHHVGGIYLSRDSVNVGLTDFSGTVFDAVSFPTAECESGREVVERASACLARMLEVIKPPGTLLGVGVTSPGPLDMKTGTIADPPFFDLMWNCPVSPILRNRFSCDVILENDANALAMAERWYGLKDKYDRFLELLVDTGIGAAIILDGKLQNGPPGFGNGFGHTSIDINGPRCDCGNTGCVEIYASIRGIVAQAQKLDARLTDWRAVADGAYAGNEAALQILNSEARYLAVVIVNASNILDLQAVVCAGEHILYRPTLLLEAVEREVRQRMARKTQPVAILPSQIPPHAQVLSGTNLVIEKYMERPFLFSSTTRYRQPVV